MSDQKGFLKTFFYNYLLEEEATWQIEIRVWDVTEDNAPKKYEGERVCLWNLCNNDYALSCIKLFNNNRLGVGDEIGLFWNPRSSNFMFKLLSRPTI
ncbi:hypothetical protein H5410_028582 [Solanum commersonii]|uniref:Uncharacterized protein n=1 Tax=Solanum commersonii TaxID=4109 RepID=A0A9J5Z333_SOLCO|nr:hypothetical protein H5410_028582 [Solanum commersonii]